MDMNLSQRTELFSRLISCGQRIAYWELDPSLQVIHTTCQHSELFHAYLMADASRESLLQYLRDVQNAPLMIAGTVGLSWVASPEIVDGVVCRLHLIGPVFTSDVSYLTLEKKLVQRSYSAEFIQRFMEQLRSVPVIHPSSWMHFGLMLHCCITGQQLEISDFLYAGTPDRPEHSQDTTPAPSGSTWYNEQLLMKMVEEGRTDYKKAMSRLSTSGSAATMSQGMSLRGTKNYVIASITLVTRAAIRGGLDPHTAYYLGETYLKNAENCSSIHELASLNTMLYDDFVQRVHKARQSTQISLAIQSCCGYIDLHLGEKINLKFLAQEAGYSEYYLAQKFKKEVGLTVSQYIRQQRIEQAKLLLRSTNRSIQSIGEELGFCTPSYFSDSFREVTGMSPGEYRERGKE